jgi:glycosyltransferase involved in cell wall biosynthesis
MNNIKLSVIIPTHNRPKELLQTLECLKRQNIPAEEYEIIVVDDGSWPPIQLTFGTDSPKWTIVRLEGVERSAARNAGAVAASGRILAFVDDDISVDSNFLSSHLRAHDEWRDVLAVGSMRLSDSLLATPYGRFRQSLEQNGIPKGRGLTKMQNLCTAANMSAPKELFSRLNGFDVELNSAEDQDLALRHTSRGGIIAYIPEAVAIHNDSAIDIESYCKRSEWGARQMVNFGNRYPDWPDNFERDRVNGAVKWGGEPISRSLSKLLKNILSSAPILAGMFSVAHILERSAPNSFALVRIYKFLLGAHLFKGYRNGRSGQEPLTGPQFVAASSRGASPKRELNENETHSAFRTG